MNNSQSIEPALDQVNAHLSQVCVMLPLVGSVEEELLVHTLLSLSLQDDYHLELVVITDKSQCDRIRTTIANRPFFKEPDVTWVFEDHLTSKPKRFHDWLQLSSAQYVSLIEAGDVLYHKAFTNSCESLSQSSRVISIGTFRVAYAEVFESGIYISSKKSLPAPDESFLNGMGASVIPTAAILLNRQLALEVEGLNFEFTMDNLREQFIKTCLSQPHPAYEMSGIPIAERRVIAQKQT